MIEDKFYKIEKNHYGFHDSNDFNIGLLYTLVDDFSSTGFYQILIDSLSDINSTGITGELTYLDIENNRATIQYQFDDEEKTLTIDRAHLLELVKKWRELCEQNVPGIVISREGDKFEIAAINQ